MHKAQAKIHMEDDSTEVFGHLLNFFHAWCAYTTGTSSNTCSREKKTLGRTEFGEGK
jgi:hypothetical protein